MSVVWAYRIGMVLVAIGFYAAGYIHGNNR